MPTQLTADGPSVPPVLPEPTATQDAPRTDAQHDIAAHEQRVLAPDDAEAHDGAGGRLRGHKAREPQSPSAERLLSTGQARLDRVYDRLIALGLRRRARLRQDAAQAEE